MSHIKPGKPCGVTAVDHSMHYTLAYVARSCNKVFRCNAELLLSTWYRSVTAGRSAVSKLKHCFKACCNQFGRLLGTVGGSLLRMTDSICSGLCPKQDCCPVTRCRMQAANPHTSVWVPLESQASSACSGPLQVVTHPQVNQCSDLI